MVHFRSRLKVRSATPRRVRRCLRGHSRFVPAIAFLLLIAGVAAPTAAWADECEWVTENFRVAASDPDVARTVARRAEQLRSAAAREWLGRELSAWSDKCRIRVDTKGPRLSGDTTYVLLRGDVRRWRMELRGDPQRILDILLPHEIVHTVLATHFRRPIPRWADEGAALSAEDARERDRLWKLESPKLVGRDRIPLQELLVTQDYPAGRDAIRRFYVQGASLTEFLLQAGKPQFIKFVGAGMRDGWESSVQQHYGFDDLASLEQAWHDWIVRDRPKIALQPEQLLMTAFQFDNHIPDVDSAPLQVSVPANRRAARSAAVTDLAAGER